MSRTLTAPLALLLATVLLVVGGAGGAAAAKLITGKQIKNGTITSVDLKNGSATGADVRDGSLSGLDVANGSLTGADVKAGSLGADRLAPAARNEVRVQVGDSQDIGTCSDTGLGDCTPLAAVTLGAGTWLVTGTVTVKNKDNVATALSDTCGLSSAAGSHPDARFPLAASGQPGETQTLSLQDVVVLAGGSLAVSLRCTEMGGEDVRVASPTITAVRVS